MRLVNGGMSWGCGTGKGKGSFLHRAGSFNFAQDERRRERQRRRQVLGSKIPRVRESSVVTQAALALAEA